VELADVWWWLNIIKCEKEKVILSHQFCYDNSLGSESSGLSSKLMLCLRLMVSSVRHPTLLMDLSLMSCPKDFSDVFLLFYWKRVYLTSYFFLAENSALSFLYLSLYLVSSSDLFFTYSLTSSTCLRWM
jgi:hypothetical protein